jgi:DNA-binding transcriptional regulator LsrR (DeoR family)
MSTLCSITADRSVRRHATRTGTWKVTQMEFVGQPASGARVAGIMRLAAIARDFYLAGKSKSDIAEEYGISRFKVARLLEEARAAGVIRLSIEVPFGVDIEMSWRLQSAYGLRHAIVIDSPEVPETLLRARLARVAAGLLTEIVTDEDVLGVGYGRTLTVLAESLESLPACTVVQITGALVGVNPAENSVELVRRIAAVSGGPCFSMYSPQVLPDAATAATLRNQPEVAEAYRRFDSITKAILPVGSWDPPHSQLHDALTPEEQADLRARGTCAEISATLVDASGHQVAHEFSERCIAISGEQLKNIDEVIVVGGGLVKAAAIRAVLIGGYANSLVTERGVAQALLESAKASARVKKGVTTRGKRIK